MHGLACEVSTVPVCISATAGGILRVDCGWIWGLPWMMTGRPGLESYGLGCNERIDHCSISLGRKIKKVTLGSLGVIILRL